MTWLLHFLLHCNSKNNLVTDEGDQTKKLQMKTDFTLNIMPHLQHWPTVEGIVLLMFITVLFLVLT